MERTLSFLYLEDSDLDVQIFSSTLLKEGIKHKLIHAKTRTEFIQALKDHSFDIIFSDYALPAFDGLSALEMVKNLCPDTPFIIVSGNIGEELAIETLKRGATDYVLKSHFTRLIPSITRALNEKKAMEKAKTDEEIKSRYDFIVNSSRSFLSLVDRNYTYEAINNAFCSAHNLVREEIIGKKLSEIWGEETFSSTIKKNIDSSFANREVHYQAWFETPRDGLRCYEVSFYPYRNEKGEITHTVVDTSDITEKKKAEKAIRESEEKYRTLVERARDGIIILTRGTIVFVNNFLLEITGYQRSEVLGQIFTRFIHPAYQVKALDQYRRRMQQTDGPSIYETVLKGKDGREIFMEVNAIAIKYSGEKAEMFILRDITNRKKTEEALTASEIKFKSFVDQTPEGIIIVDENGRVSEWNKGMEMITGLTRAETLEKFIWDVQGILMEKYDKEYNLEHYRELVLNALKTGKGEWLYRIEENEIPAPDGTVYIQSSVFPVRTKKGYMLGGVVREITAVKQAEIEMRKNRDFLETLNNYIGDGVVAFAFPQKLIEYTNLTSRQIFGYEEKEMLGKTTELLWPERKNHRLFVKEMLRNREKGNTYFVSENILKRKTGETFHAELTVSLLSGNGNPDRVIMVVRDISERRFAEVKIRKQTEDLTLINELNKAVNEGKSLNRIYHILSLSMRNIFSSLVTSIHLVADDKKWLLPVHTALPTRSKKKITRMAGRDLSSVKISLSSKSIYQGIIRGRAPRQFRTRAGILRIMSEWIDPVRPETALPEIYEYSKIRAILSIPLYTGDEGIGILEISRDTPFSEDDVNRIFSISRQISSVITRKLNEDRLLDSESRYRVLFETANDSIFLLENNRFIDCNRRTLEIFGAGREHLIGATPVDFSPAIQPDGRKSREKAAEMIKRAMNNGPQHFEWLHHKLDKTPFFAEVSLNRIQIKGKFYLQAIVRDISEKKKSEEEQMRLITAIEQSDETVVITDKKGIIRYVNPAFEKTSGYPRREAIGKNPAILQSGRHDKNFYDEMWKRLIKGKVWKGRFINRRKDGSLYEELATISPITDEKKQIVNFVAVKRDITKESQLETQLRQVQKMETIGTLAGGIAHDFNNILATIMGYTDMILKDLDSSSPLTDDVKHIMNASMRGKELVKKILTFSRQVDHRNDPVHYDLVLKESIELIRTTMPSNIFIRDRICEECPPLKGDPTQLQQVFINLCTNAFYAMKEKGGFLDIALDSLYASDPVLAKLPRLMERNCLALTVRDEGTGMKPDVLRRIFEPFFTTKPVGEGTGLGLSVTHGIIQNMGGEVVVESEWGKGTTFNVFFPVEGMPELAAGKTKEPVAQGKGHVLIVDDEPYIASMIAEVLKEAGYRVTAFSDPLRAVEWCRKTKSRFDLLIISQVMKALTGEETAKGIWSVRPAIPLIMTATYSDLSSGEKVRKSGAGEYLYKPLISSDLYRAVRDVLGSSKSHNS